MFLFNEFEMIDMGKLSYFLGLQFHQTSLGIILHQQKYMREILKRFNMLGCNPAVTPIEVNAKLEKNMEEEPLDSTLFKKVVGSLR